MDDEQVNMKIAIAVLEKELHGIREQQRAHAAETREQFTKVNDSIAKLFEAMNKGRGAFAAALFMAGIIGGGIVKMASALMARE